MKLLEYQSTPIILSNQTEQQLFINPIKPIIAVDNDLTLYAVYDKAELHHDCKSIHDNFYCENKNILKRTSSSDCTLALYRRLKDEIRTKCPIELTTQKGGYHSNLQYNILRLHSKLYGHLYYLPRTGTRETETQCIQHCDSNTRSQSCVEPTRVFTRNID